MKAKKSTINGLWYVPITSVNKKDNLQLDNNRGVNPDQQELNTTTHQEYVKPSQTGERTQMATQNQQIAANAITQVPTMSKAELAMYHHQSLGNPRKDTLLRALKRHPGQFATFPGLNWDLIQNHLPPSEATDKGHMIMTRKGLKSTRAIARQINKTTSRRDISTVVPR